MSVRENDVRRFFSKYTSMSNLKTKQLPKCEQDITDIQEIIDAGNFQEIEFDLDDYKRGLAYFFGVGNVRDDEAGLRYLKLAADDGYIDAMNMYGFACYHTSLACKEEAEKKNWYERQAIKWFKEAAGMGQVEAIFNLGVCLVEGIGTEADDAEGMRYLETASKKGHPRAALYLADYKSKHGQGPEILREGQKEEIFAQIAETMKKEAEESGISHIYVTGLFNDIYLEKGYKWVKNASLGWICSKDEGKSYLISEEELNTLATFLE